LGPKRDEVIEEWRRLQIEELYDMYSSPNITWVIKSRRLKWAGHVARMGARRGAYRVLVGKPKHRWEDIIKMHLREVEWGHGLDRSSSG
jgi:hypothetical protein